ncbi:MAG: beta-methylgalactoside transporter, partial [Clostridia bacterium]|nr:beta-methylgalactoside transporter [Clostridia bacterium]
AGVFMQKADFANKMFANLPEINGWWIAATVLTVVLIGAIIGLVNGFFVAKFSLHPFIVTLSTQLITYGIILWFFALNGNNGQPISGLSAEYKDFVGGAMFRLGGVAVPRYVLYAVILTALMWFIWNKTTFGKNMFAVGSNAEAAKVSGVNVFLTTMLVHTLAGAMYGYAGFIEGVRAGSVAASTGLNAECDAIAACVIGGVSFVGGTGKISGIILGVFVLRIIFVALTMLGVDSSSLYIIKGAIILCACALDMRKYLVKK